MTSLLYCVGRAVAHQGLGNLAVAVAEMSLVRTGNILGRIAADAWQFWQLGKDREQLNADILAAAQMSFADARRDAAQVAREVAPDDVELQGHVERLVSQVPGCIRKSLQRPEDLSGRSVPAGFAVADEHDLAKLLPTQLPRFKPGDAPPFLKGWVLVEPIGAGGFGEVWKARHPQRTALVGAVKFGFGLTESENSLLHEGDVIDRVMGHSREMPGIVPLLDASDDGDAVPWLRYEYIPGGDLTGRILHWQTLPPADRLTEVLTAFLGLAETVAHFHRLSPAIVHRDLKPSNILFDGTRLRVADFGIGAVSAKRMLDGERAGAVPASLRFQKHVRGSHTPVYAGPQQRGGSAPDPRDDVHALGVILYQMLTGKLDQAPAAKFERGLTALGVPKAVVDLIGDCVDPAADTRIAHAGVVANRCGDALAAPKTTAGKAAATAKKLAADTGQGAKKVASAVGKWASASGSGGAGARRAVRHSAGFFRRCWNAIAGLFGKKKEG